METSNCAVISRALSGRRIFREKPGAASASADLPPANIRHPSGMQVRKYFCKIHSTENCEEPDIFVNYSIFTIFKSLLEDRSAFFGGTDGESFAAR